MVNMLECVYLYVTMIRGIRPAEVLCQKGFITNQCFTKVLQ